MHDRFGRSIRYLRLSVTPACSMRCVYCRPVGIGNDSLSGLMSPREFEQVVRHLVESHGLSKVRLTGGEPTARSDILQIVRRIAGIRGIQDLAMTTNGLTLPRLARPLREAGLRRVNISLDSLEPKRFADMTGVDGLERVKQGIDAALQAELRPVKLNTVVVRGQNDQELPDLIRFAAEKDLEIRFIELMPMGPLADQWKHRYVCADEMRRTIAPHVLVSQDQVRDASAARLVRAVLPDGRIARYGFITPMSCPFCDLCNRIRISAEGALFPCLMDRPKANLMSAIRPHFDPEAFDAILFDALESKQEEHPSTGFIPMIQIGG